MWWPIPIIPAFEKAGGVQSHTVVSWKPAKQCGNPVSKQTPTPHSMWISAFEIRCISEALILKRKTTLEQK